MTWETVIGLETHVELATRTKIFCACTTEFGGAPNTHCCPVCTGMPGALPVPNRQAVHYAALVGLATNCAINRRSIFARKNYFYPDLPSGYQISQFDLPICEHGYLDIEVDGASKRIGITRSQMARGITIATQGYTLGEYREGDQFMPILLKDENIGSYNLTNLQALPIFNPSGKVFSIEQATDGFRFDFRPGVIKRFNRQRVMKAQCDPGRGVNTMQLFAALRDSVDRAVVLPEGYSMKVFGEQESQQESNEALAEYMPLTLVLILIVLLLLLRNYREPVVILLMIPLIFIGVVLGLAVTGKVFNFFSLLGLLGLVGMNIKNAVVLVEQIGVLRAAGKDPYEALTSATRSRIVPVAMASGTTILGMLPLLFDSMFGAMAATIMGGLLVATLLTVCVLPVVYALFYNIRKP